MKFFDRQQETQWLLDTLERSKTSAQFTVLSGRRRIGKTSLVLHAYYNMPCLYFFVAKKAEADLCEDFVQEISNKLHVPIIGRVDRFAKIFELVMQLAQQQNITLFIDEFQDFKRVNASIYSEMQKIWDLYKSDAKINLIVGGSVKSLMQKIFEDKSEPLYGRQTQQIMLTRFAPSVLKEILGEYNPNYTKEDLLALYAFTGGVAKYVELLMDAGATTKRKMLNYIIQPNSVFIAEGKNLLVEEFGKDHGVYFSILSALATGHHLRSQLEDIIGKELGGYLTALENVYGLIRTHVPMFASTKKSTRYVLNDNFLIFWFRYIFKYNYMLEIGAYAQLRELIDHDYETFTGQCLERYFKEQLVETQQFTRIDAWWSRNGQDEIDIVALNEMNSTAIFYEVKRQSKAYNENKFLEHIAAFLQTTRQLKGYSITHQLLCMEDM
jgi:AAA+ ATPase superfamily predicted ATPase